ncbi:MAG: V-type ATP synthase subunit D [Candidatus Omnitrophica bacterium]|nr:V-type ATP synthase subunit D [Candidatus Omnitrophota bacterium]MCF7891929.1 V-type ATP synthase subunit D [Candidatus Omnitrophota bacterium]MCF7897452.1 V-type ATP synthase subunit D [Candidatus Omnitrophota bacterium]MCF7909370.1 V-type ATP synthase subunit D [Candidatus Omnitrophota bacterium]
MGQVRITKQELRKQKDSLARFRRYLPTLQLKKKQLQQQIVKVHQQIDKVSKEEEDFRNEVINWVDLFAQQNSIREVLSLKAIKTGRGNVAGVDLPIFDRVDFELKSYNLVETPLWLDSGIEAVKKVINYKAELIVLHRQLDALKEELRLTNQRVNLFEKVKIPESEGNIRMIQIYLGERRTAAVVRGKIAKAKIDK